MQPFIQRIYNAGSTTRFKEDKSAVTLADIIVQELLHLLLAPVTVAFIGEESAEEYVIDDPILAQEVAYARRAIQALELPATLCALNLTAVIDPIDGTAEFSTGKGHESTICIGFAQGAPVAGLVFRPIEGIYAAGCCSEGYFNTNLVRTKLNRTTVLTSNGRISTFIEGLGLTRVPAGGCGNKILLILEGQGIYILDRGVSRWDSLCCTGYPRGGGRRIVYIDEFFCPVKWRDTYALTDVNLDPNPLAVAGPMNSSGTRMKPYSNLCGLVAVPRECNNSEYMEALRTRCLSSSAPAYS
jgi:3'-phosphoadenosine 5'-phosphosulfate (PAPS) 3'-phosphatase